MAITSVRASTGAADQRPAGQARWLSWIWALSSVHRRQPVVALPQAILGTSGRRRVKL